MAKVTVRRMFDYDPLDLAVNFYNVVTDQFGADPFLGLRRRFRTVPVQYMTVKVGPGQEGNIVVGGFKIKNMKGEFFLDGNTVDSVVDKEEKSRVEGLLAAVDRRLQTSSLYRGKPVAIAWRAFKDAVMPYGDFLEGINISSDSLVYNPKVLQDLKDQVWTVLQKSDLCRRNGIRLQRKILLSGKFGSGKTMAAILTMKIALENGWTPFYLVPTPQIDTGMLINYAMDISKKYTPAVLILEDIDREQRMGDKFVLGGLMNKLDGILSKNSEILVIMTTNHNDRIAGGLQRPGRIDRIINFDQFDSQDIERLLKLVIPGDMLDANINWDIVAEEARDYPPAFLNNGVATSAKLMAISRSDNDKPFPINQEMLVQICRDLRGQYQACMKELQMGFSA